MTWLDAGGLLQRIRHASESWHLGRPSANISDMQKGGWIYIMTNKRYGVLYVGVTSNLPARILQHREGRGSRFAKRYNLNQLVYYEWIPTIEEAIVREKQVKAWKRMWRIELIEKMNPGWDDLYDQLNA